MTRRIKDLGRCFFTASSPLGKATVFMDITLSFLCSSAISVSHSFQHQATEHCHFKSFLALTYSLSPNLVFLHRNKEVDFQSGYVLWILFMSVLWFRWLERCSDRYLQKTYTIHVFQFLLAFIEQANVLPHVLCIGDIHCKESKLQFFSYWFVGLGLALVYRNLVQMTI